MTTNTVPRLHPGSHGRWLIHTRGSVHILDLDARTYQRRPGPTSRRFPHDNTTQTLTRVETWPEVGGRMLIWTDDPELPELFEHWRLTSTIRQITRDDQGCPGRVPENS